jgi:RHS repeat-associated protein
VGSTVAEEQRWIYRDGINPVAELNGSNEMVARYVYQSSGHVPDLVVRYDGPAPVRYRVVTDLRGSVLALVEVETGAVAQSFEYDARGNILSQSGDPSLQPFRFAGGLYDGQTGLIRFGARDYDPRIGRWTAKDPIRWGGGQPNLYEYVSGDPVNWVDPSGLVPEPCGPPSSKPDGTGGEPCRMPRVEGLDCQQSCQFYSSEVFTACMDENTSIPGIALCYWVAHVYKTDCIGGCGLEEIACGSSPSSGPGGGLPGGGPGLPVAPLPRF